MKGVSYLRLSQESDRSIPSQREDIEKYCEQNDINLVKEFNDGQNSSGFNDERPEYRKMKKRLAIGDIDAVIIRDRQRIGRNFDERMRFILDLREEGVELHTWSDGKIDLEDPYSVAVEGIHSASDDKKKREEIKKAKHELKKREEKGYPSGRAPKGLKYNKEKTALIPDDEFQNVIEVLDLREEGKSYPQIEKETDINKSTAYRIVQKKQMYREKQEEEL